MVELSHASRAPIRPWTKSSDSRTISSAGIRGQRLFRLAESKDKAVGADVAENVVTKTRQRGEEWRVLLLAHTTSLQFVPRGLGWMDERNLKAFACKV
jgi:hypothetical protein